MKGYEQFAKNVAMSPETVDKARRTMEASAMNDHALEAAGNAEDIIRVLTSMWGDHGFTPEQCVFALALATINFRETIPEAYGGKDMFDRVAHEAHKYYHSNK